MPFDIEGAKKSGYSDSEIAEYLSKQSNFDITSARNSGYKDDEIVNHLSVKPQLKTEVEAQIKPKEQPYSWKDAIADTLIGGGGVLRNLPLSQRTKQGISNVADPTLRGVGMGVGATVGNVALPIYGGMAGAGGGQAMGGAVSDILKRQLGLEEWPSTTEALTQQARDALTGATWEGIGQTAIPIVGGIGKGVKKAYNYLTSPIREHGAQEFAGKQYEQLIKKALENDLFRKNVDEAIDLGEEMGATFTKGQASNAPSIVLKERALARSVPGGGDVDVLNIANQNKSIGDYFGKQFLKGNRDDLLVNIKQYADDLSKQSATYQDDLTRQMSQMRTERTPYQSGETLRQAKFGLVNRRRPVVEKLFNEVPNVHIEINPVVDKFDDIKKFIKEHPEYRREDVPLETMGRIKNYIKTITQADVENELRKTVKNQSDELLGEMDAPGIFSKIKQITNKINIGRNSPVYDNFERHEIKSLVRKQPGMFSTKEGMGFDEVADGLKISTDDLANQLREAVSKSSAKETSKNQISQYLTQGQEVETGKDIITMPFQQLRGERNNFYQELKIMQSKLPPNDRLLQKMNEFRGAFEDSLNNIALHPPEVSQKYQKASAFYKKYYLPLKQGVSREITAKNAFGEYRVDTEKVPQKIFNSVTDAKQFMNTLPKSEAKQAMKDYAAGNLIGNHVVYNPQTGDINPKAYNVWLKRNAEVLNELGIYKDFDDVSKVVTNLEVAKHAKNSYDKSIVSKLIGVDAENAIGNVFSGTSGKSPIGTMHELVNRAKQTKHPESAINGLKKGFSEYFEKTIEAKTIDAFGNPNPNPTKGREFLEKYKGALAVLFKDEPEKIEALKKVQKGYEIMLRNQRSPFPGGGSATAEHHFAVIKHRIIKSIPFIGTSYIRLQGFGQQQADTYLMRALYDPEFAYTLVNTIKNPSLFDAKVKGQLMAKPVGTMIGAGMSILQNQPK